MNKPERRSRAANGSDGPINWGLVADNVGLCWSHAQWLSKKIGIPLLFSQGFVENVATGECLDVLVRCARLYDPEKGAKFSTYVYISLKRSVRPSFVLPFVSASEDAMHGLPESGGFCLAEGRAEVYNILERLSEEDRTVLLLRYWKGLTSREMAVRLKCSRTTVMTRLGDALRRAKKAVGLS